MMFCSQCGKKIPDGAAFCPECGANLKMVPNDDFDDTRAAQSDGLLSEVSNLQVNEGGTQWPEDTVGIYGTAGNIPTDGDSGTAYAGSYVSGNNMGQGGNSNPYEGDWEKPRRKNNLWAVVVIEVIAILVVTCGIIVMIRGNRDSGGGDEEMSVQEVLDESSQADSGSEEQLVTVEETNAENEQVAETVIETPTPIPTPTEKIVKETTCYVTDAQPSDLGNYRRPSFTSANASSFLVQRDHPDYDNSANSIIDGDYITSWQDGSPGNGTGESLTLKFSGDQSVKYLEFHLGNWRTERYYNINSRPRQMTMTINGKRYPLDFTDAKISHYVVFEEAVSMDSVDFYIDSVYSGAETGDCCIGEITAYAD